ncbi:hypothetical protein VLK31_35165 [Variovorax sp. H27-G14]|uniref:hypothetical protein n=1 Tax=Variovorax sp. H27-G14 TaxID=3111914 RepID=UPI0038FCEACC
MIQMEETEAGDYQMRQTLYEPVVYMDHWAVRKFSTDKALRGRFITALHRSGGTLLVSLHNFGEFSGVSVEEHAVAAEEFFDLALPRMFVADFGADLGFIQLRGRPTADGKQENLILVEMAKRWLENGHQLSMAGLVNESEENRAIVSRALKDLQVGIAKAVNSVKADPQKVGVARANKKPPGATLRDLVQDAFLRDFVVNEEAVFGEHDASDFVHAFGAVMASDFVLLDGRWAHIVNQADKQLKKKGVTHRLPKAFPERQVPQFMDALEAYQEATGERKAKTISR